jgi:flagellar motor protein MotB
MHKRAILFREGEVRVEPDDTHASPLVLAQRRIAQLTAELKQERANICQLDREIDRLEERLREAPSDADLWRDDEDVGRLIMRCAQLEASIYTLEHKLTKSPLATTLRDHAELSNKRAQRAALISEIRACFIE